MHVEQYQSINVNPVKTLNNMENLHLNFHNHSEISKYFIACDSKSKNMGIDPDKILANKAVDADEYLPF